MTDHPKPFSLVYPKITGTHRDLPLWPADVPEGDRPEIIARLVTALQDQNIPMDIFGPVSIQVVRHPLYRCTDEPKGYWIAVEDLTLDALIESQAGPGSSHIAYRMSGPGRSTAMAAYLDKLPTLSHCIAFWARAASPHNQSPRGYPSFSPVRQDDPEHGLLDDAVASWLDPHIQRTLHSQQIRLFRTPKTVSSSTKQPAEGALVGHIVGRITYCLARYRPVLLSTVEEPPTDIIKDLISNARREYAT